jgi:uncharacterized membrane protein
MSTGTWGGLYLFTGKVMESFWFTLIAAMVGIVLYYIYERIWNQIHWGRHIGNDVSRVAKRARSFAAWSNVFYLIPFGIALFFSLWFVAASVFLLFIASTGLHLFRSRFFSQADRLCSFEIAIIGIGLIVMSQVANPYLFLAFTCFGIGLYFYLYMSRRKRDHVWHGWWHACVAASISFSILSFSHPFLLF